MKILNKYLYKKLLIYLLVILPSVSFISILVELIELLRKTKEINVFYILMYAFYKMPEKIYLILPVSSVIVFALLARDLINSKEIYPILLNGISLRKLFSIFLVFAIFLSLFQVLNLEFLLPVSEKKAEVIYRKLRHKTEKEKNFIAFNTWITLDKKTFMYFDVLDFNTRTGKNITIIRLNDDFKPVLRIEGKSFLISKNKIVINTGKIIDLKNVFSFKITTFNTYPFFMNLDLNEFKKLVEVKKPVSLRQLYKTARIAEKYGYPSSYYWSRFFSKLSTVFSPLILSIAVYPFIWKQRKENIGIIVILILLYWYGTGFLTSIAESNVIPYFAVLSMDIIYIFVGLLFLRKLQFIEF